MPFIFRSIYSLPARLVPCAGYPRNQQDQIKIHMHFLHVTSRFHPAGHLRASFPVNMDTSEHSQVAKARLSSVSFCNANKASLQLPGLMLEGIDRNLFETCLSVGDRAN